ncbi:MAG: hypothetical protein Tsb0020_23110 [Haliangiales bacterium]
MFVIDSHQLSARWVSQLLLPSGFALAATATLALAAHGCGGAPSVTSTAAPASEPALATVTAAPDPVKYADPLLLPEPITSFGAAVQGGFLYVLGGYTGTPHQYSRDGQSGALSRIRLDQAGQRDGATQRRVWEQLPGVEPLQSVALVAHDDALIRVGGMRASNPAGQPSRLASTDEVARYLPATSAWEALPPLPAPRSSHDAVVLHSTVYVLGGWRLDDGDEAQWAREGLALDLRDGDASWRSFATPFQRRALATVAAGDRVLAIGGMNADGSLSQQVDIYDPATDTWTRGPDYPGPAFGVAATAAGDTIYASGMDGIVYEMDLGDAATARSWRQLNTLTFPRFFHRLAVADDQVLALGGIVGMSSTGRVRVVERIARDRQARQPSVSRITLKSPSAAKNRQGIFLHQHSLYLFGGNRSLGQHDFGPEYFLSESHRLNLASLTWNKAAPFPVARQTMQTVVDADSGLGVSVGGFGYDGQVSRTFADSYQFDFKANQWRPALQPLPQPRSQFGLTSHNDELWVFGGLDYDPKRPEGDQFRHLVNVMKTSATDSAAAWSDTDVTLPQPRRAFGGATLGGRYYMVGGMRDGFEFVTDCDVYEFESATWRKIPAPQRTRLSPQLVALDGKLYLAGGSSRSDSGELQPDASIEVFDPETNQWSVLIERLPLVTKHMRMTAYGHRLLLYSAHSPADEVHLMVVDPG